MARHCKSILHVSLVGLIAIAMNAVAYVEATTGAGDRVVDRTESAIREAGAKPEPGEGVALSRKVAAMTLEQKIGQMMMFGFDGYASKTAVEMTKRYHLGGIILFKHNIAGRTELISLIKDVQNAAKADSGVGLLISTDEEGGKVDRLSDVTGHKYRSNAKWSELYAKDKIKAREGVTAQAAGTAGDMIKLGVNMNLAPVIDVVTDAKNTVIGTAERAFGTKESVISDLGCRYITALQAAGVIATAKHYPGHGPTPVDSHIDRPVSDISLEELEAVHLKPFARAVDAGVAAIMTAHVVYPAVDADRPATLSPSWLGDRLRKGLGFKGIIITDGMLMGAVGKHYTVGEAAVSAILAGADILLFDHGTKQQAEAFSAVVSAAKKGHISKNRIDASVNRILSTKQRFGIW